MLAEEDGLDIRDVARASIVTDNYDEEPKRRLVAEFTPSGAVAFADLTEALIGRLLSITIDGEMVSAAMVMVRIDGGRVEISLQEEPTREQWEAQASALAAALSYPGLVSTWKLAP